MKYKENETLIKEATTVESPVEEISTDTSTTNKENLYCFIRKTIDLRFKIIEESLVDLKNAFAQLEDLYNEKDD